MMEQEKTHYINGTWLSSQGQLMQSLNPATNKTIWQGHEATEDIVNKAVKAAQEAYNQWKTLPLPDRINFLRNFGSIITTRKNELAETISMENGKPLWEALTEVTAMIGKIDLSVDSYNKRCPEVVQQLPHATAVTRHQPHGPLAVLGPFNFPAHLPNGHIIPALLAGNTIIFKPSEQTPLVAQVTMECWHASGMPAGVINMVQGGSSTGKWLTSHSGVKGILFTGSWGTGSMLSEIFAKTPNKILALEMGGNNPLVIGDVANITAAAYLAAQTAFLTSGQRCTCARRLIIPQGPQGDEILKSLIKTVESLRVGPYTEKPEPFMGPLISAKAADTVFLKYQELVAKGGKPLVPMKQLPLGRAFLSPGIIDMTGVKNLSDEEIFGPLLQVFRTKDFHAAIEEANNTQYGLSAGLFSDKKEQFDEFYNKIHAGLVNWNMPLTGASSAAPFGGLGKSGNFRPSAFYAADYCSYPVVSVETENLTFPAQAYPGIGANASEGCCG